MDATTGIPGAIGPYQVLGSLGAGGMGQVCRALDPRLDREVAIKVVAERLTRDGSAVDRFVREAHAASRLNHPNIVTIQEIGEADVGRFIVMELVEGKTLRELIAERPACESVVDIGRQIAKAYGWFTEGPDTPDMKEARVLLTSLSCSRARSTLRAREGSRCWGGLKMSAAHFSMRALSSLARCPPLASSLRTAAGRARSARAGCRRIFPQPASSRIGIEMTCPSS